MTTEAQCSALPTPTLARWQPLRLGLVELFHYDSEEFWFRDGHLLLRGNNGTGKSKVLSLTLPFLFDAQLKPSRIEPDGDAGKKMAWNLLLGRHDRRMGYAWVEFGRLGKDGQPHYLTLGCGLSAVAARPQVDSWFFILENQRIGEDLWLMSPSKVVLTRERLRETLQERAGQVFDTAAAYRRAVDERLFRLGQARYTALMDTLIQLRQPQLSKKPDEGNLSNAMTEALPPMSQDLLADVADSLNQLEEYRRELEEYEALARAVGQFNQRYQLYAATQARRQARHLRSAQTGFDNASRVLNEDRTTLEKARIDETAAATLHRDSEAALATSRIRLEELQNDPTMASAKQLEQADRDAAQKSKDAEQALRARREAQIRLERERETSHARGQQVARATTKLEDARGDAAGCARQTGLDSGYADNLLSHVQPEALVALDAFILETAHQDLRRLLTQRREQVDLIGNLCEEVERAAQAHARQQTECEAKRYDAETAAERREQADAAVARQGRDLLEAWQRHIEGLQQLRITDSEPVFQALALWTAGLQGDNPARSALHLAQQDSSLRLARRQSTLQTERDTLEQEQAGLHAERVRLEQGKDKAPPAAHWHSVEDRADRAGAPLWQLVDFHPNTPEADRAGLEAALQAAGLLDAWVTPDGHLHTPEGQPWPHDSHWLKRPAQAQALVRFVIPAVDAPSTVPSSVLQSLLEGVACGPRDDLDAEAWMSPDGRFRLGALAGAWQKPSAEFIGHAARAAARARRLNDISVRMAEIEQALAVVQQTSTQLAKDQERALEEWQTAPPDEALRAAHLTATAQARELQAALLRFDQASQALQTAKASWESARQRLTHDASDLQLPDTRDALQTVSTVLRTFGETSHTLVNAIRELRDGLIEHARQHQRTQEAESDTYQADEQFAEREALAEEARIRLDTLQSSVGAKVEKLQQRLTAARAAVVSGEKLLKSHEQGLRITGEARARAEQKAQDAEATLNERTDVRQQAVAQLQDFVTTGLLATAAIDAEIPPLQTPWTIDPALALARRIEQALLHVKDDDDAWTRVQNHISQDYTELGRTLAALSHQAQAETSDFGLIVSIVYQSRPERPDQLGARLDGEIAQRRELLTAGERKVLENHLQAEIASAVQKLLRDAERQIKSINDELEKRPTSTGVRFRLQWQTLPEGADGAPVGLEAARRRLLNTSTDLWTPEDRRVVGEMLQQRIAAERTRADADQGGSLLEQLARALDYRHWHRFRVQRWQDGQWRPLSGPASSGERALGLTVPLFAAVSSYYTQEGYAHAPRLVLLDEAFAGIDDAARAHCMALVREFDLDFVITSEREWACYAELPGVAIAQLQRREGIDAVHVSRWTWDGRARRRDDDPDRRFPPSA